MLGRLEVRVPLLFTAAIFVSAALLFLVEPMIAKMILPKFGGTAAVWNTCMVFFQAMLLLGYAYAHALPRWLGVRRHVALHLGVLLLPALVLPIAVSATWAPPGDGYPVPWVLGLLCASVGLPFFVLSTSTPLLQRWFAATGHRRAADPYFLYAASNLGSMVALLSYPLLVEPHLSLRAQSRLWAAGYCLLLLLCAGAALVVRRALPGAPGGPSEPGDTRAPGEPDDRPTLLRRLRWVLLSLGPSSLVLGMTTYLTTDVAAMPLLWVVPLSIYLLTFILAFARRPPRPVHVMGGVLLVLLSIVGLVFGRIIPMVLESFLLQLLLLFLGAMTCHGELAHGRPAPRYLTQYYVWISVGGVLGGLWNALLAPLCFTSIAEYPIAIALCCIFLPFTNTGRHGPAGAPDPQIRYVRYLPGLLAMGIGMLLLTFALKTPVRGHLLHKERSFFGVLRVEITASSKHHQLMHGSTLHGWQLIDPALRDTPLTYYSPGGPIGQIFTSFMRRDPRQPAVPIAVIGLGTGTLSTYAQPGERIDFYEIDPAIARIAQDPTYFTFLADARARGVAVGLMLGDARLKLEQPGERYGIIAVDAFSSDNIPIHLITQEALGIYLHRLRDDGVLALHISNRFLRLQPVLANLAQSLGLSGRVREDVVRESEIGMMSSTWVVLARKEADLGPLLGDARWAPLVPNPGVGVWTDDFSNLLGVFRWH